MAKNVNVLSLVKDGESYMFLYVDTEIAEVLRQFGRFAANVDLNFNWFDAAVMSQRMKEMELIVRKHNRFVKQ